MSHSLSPSLFPVHPVSGGDEENNCASDDQVNSSPTHSHSHSHPVDTDRGAGAGGGGGEYNLPSLPKELIMRVKDDPSIAHVSSRLSPPTHLSPSYGSLSSVLPPATSSVLYSRVNMKMGTKFGPFATKIRKDPSPASFNWKVSHSKQQQRD